MYVSQCARSEIKSRATQRLLCCVEAEVLLSSYGRNSVGPVRRHALKAISHTASRPFPGCQKSHCPSMTTRSSRHPDPGTCSPLPQTAHQIGGTGRRAMLAWRCPPAPGAERAVAGQPTFHGAVSGGRLQTTSMEVTVRSIQLAGIKHLLAVLRKAFVSVQSGHPSVIHRFKVNLRRFVRRCTASTLTLGS
jgi:hypothetical protein